MIVWIVRSPRAAASDDALTAGRRSDLSMPPRGAAVEADCLAPAPADRPSDRCARGLAMQRPLRATRTRLQRPLRARDSPCSDRPGGTKHRIAIRVRSYEAARSEVSSTRAPYSSRIVGPARELPPRDAQKTTVLSNGTSARNPSRFDEDRRFFSNGARRAIDIAASRTRQTTVGAARTCARSGAALPSRRCCEPC